MSRGDWLGKLTLALVAAAALVFMVGAIAGFVFGELGEVHKANSAYQKNAEEDRRNAGNKIAQACEHREGAAFLSCVVNGLEAYYRDQATNEDLQAQQDMAFWAGALFVSSTVLTTIGIYLLFQTLLATQATLKEAEVTAKEAQNTTAAANRSADAAHEANAFTIHQFRQQHRPWLSYSDIRLTRDIRFEQGDARIDIPFEFTVINTGTDTAINCSVRVQPFNGYFGGEEDELPRMLDETERHLHDPRRPRRGIVLRGASKPWMVNSTMSWDHGGRWTEEEHYVTACLVGYISYYSTWDTLFEDEHQTWLCYLLCDRGTENPCRFNTDGTIIRASDIDLKEVPLERHPT